LTLAATRAEKTPQGVENASGDSACGNKTVSGHPVWPNSDLLGERGGSNLNGFVGNDPINRWDYLGLDLIWTAQFLAACREDGCRPLSSGRSPFS
jgi:hypothetical protein